MSGKKDKIKDKDRYSILVPDLGHCFICGTDQRICLHEVEHGTANRKKSKEDGLILPLCFEHHQGNTGVHNNSELDEYFKKQSEKIWIEKYVDHELSPEEKIQKYIDRYGKNWLETDEI